MKLVSKIGLAIALAGVLVGTASAGEIAILANGYSIRHDHRAKVNELTRLYFSVADDSYIDVATDQIVGFEKDDTPVMTPAAPKAAHSTRTVPVVDAVNAASARNGIDSDLITSVIHAESGFNPRARSPKGAQGLMQLMPGTATQLGVKNPFDPMANVDGGTRYLRELLDYYHDDMAKALAAYNAGPHRVAQYNGVPPYHETHSYVARVIREFNKKKLAARRAQPAQAAAKKPAAVATKDQPASGPSDIPT